jgi:MoxR-like ATPase
VAPTVDSYLLAIVEATRRAREIQIGVSPRGALALRRAAQAYALLEGRSHVTPDDLKALAIPVLSHRMQWTDGSVSREHAEHFVSALLNQVPVPL